MTTRMTGRQCEDLNECQMLWAGVLGPCSRDATCRNTAGSFECRCHDGYVGDGHLCADVDECRATDGAAAASCDTNGHCVNTKGSFHCACDFGFAGNGLDDCTDAIDDCAGDPCSGHGVCHDDAADSAIDDFVCVCEAGWGGEACDADVDECASEDFALLRGDCHRFAQCSNTVGSYACVCLPGFHGDGITTCDDSDDCAANRCENGGLCTDTGRNEFHCDCSIGFTGVVCELDVDECSLASAHQVGGACGGHASCRNSFGGFECQCDAGYTDDAAVAGSGAAGGAACVLLDECIAGTHDCLETAACTNLVDGTYTCSCALGESGDGTVTGTGCSDINECDASSKGGGNACAADAACTNTAGSYRCDCHDGFVGDGIECDARYWSSIRRTACTSGYRTVAGVTLSACKEACLRHDHACAHGLSFDSYGRSAKGECRVPLDTRIGCVRGASSSAIFYEMR